MRTRRMLAAAVPLLVGALLTASCSDDETSSGAEPATAQQSETTQQSETAQESGAATAFPVTVEHKYGETTVTEKPERVVSVGVTEQDILLQLGVTPVAVTEWYGEQPFATWPWAQDLLGDAEPEVLHTDDGFEFEKVAALEPDLIVGTNSGMSRKEYDLFSQIAPTIPAVQGSSPYFSPWREQTVQIATALGEEAAGQQIVDDIDARYAEVAAAHPEWADQTATFAQGGPYDGELYVYPAGLSTDFLTDLGFTMTTGFESFAPEVGSQAEISAENVGLIDADVIVFATENAEQFDELQAFGTVGNLDAVAGNRAAYTDETLAGAIYFDTPLAHAYILDHLVPMLELATQGQAPRAYPST